MSEPSPSRRSRDDSWTQVARNWVRLSLLRSDWAANFSSCRAYQEVSSTCGKIFRTATEPKPSASPIATNHNGRGWV